MLVYNLVISSMKWCGFGSALKTIHIKEKQHKSIRSLHLNLTDCCAMPYMYKYKIYFFTVSGIVYTLKNSFNCKKSGLTYTAIEKTECCDTKSF